MTLASFASAIWHPVVRPWLDTRQREAALLEAMRKAVSVRVPPCSSKLIVIRQYGGDGDKGALVHADQRPSDRR